VTTSSSHGGREAAVEILDPFIGARTEANFNSADDLGSSDLTVTVKKGL
jgi:hypothetical protein